MGKIQRKPLGGGKDSSGITFSTEAGTFPFHFDFFDSAGGRIRPYVGDVKSFPKGEHPKDHNVPVTIFPLRYTTAEPDAEKADKLRTGWLYVFQNGRVLYEFEARRGGILVLVNLETHKGKDVRPATGSSAPHLTVPHRVDGVEQTIEMAYSEVQWSWARLTSLENDEDLRRQRAQRIPLGGYPTFPLTEEGEGGARVENRTSEPRRTSIGSSSIGTPISR